MIDYNVEITSENCHEIANSTIKEYVLLYAHNAVELGDRVNTYLDQHYYLKGETFMAPNLNSHMLFQAVELDRGIVVSQKNKRFEAQQFIKKVEG